MKTATILSRMVTAGALAWALAWGAEAPKDAPKVEPYPLDTCVVSGGKLGGMGDVVKYTYKGREIRLCCQGCIKLFEKAPETYLKKLDAAAKAKAEAAKAKAESAKSAAQGETEPPAAGQAK